MTSKALSSPPKELSAEGRLLVKDLRDVINEAKKLLLSKNEGQLLQDFIWQAQRVSPGDVNAPNVPVTKETGKQDATKTLEGLKTLGTLLITNGEFRKISESTIDNKRPVRRPDKLLVSDATVLLRDIAADVSQRAANQVRPSEEQLAQIDTPAEENVWHEKPNVSKGDIKGRVKKKKTVCAQN